MPTRASGTNRKFRFGVFEVDLEVRELRKRGLRLRIQQKPFQILHRLLETPGEFVSRAELARSLWPDLHVVFDRSLNTAVNTLRSILGDPSRNPRFIETRPGLGYRFIAPVEKVGRAAPVPTEGVFDSIAVLPFENPACDPTLDSLAVGLAESLTAALSSRTRLRVIAHSSAVRFSGTNIRAQDAGRQLRVAAVLTGSLVLQATRLIVSAELVDVPTGRRLWGEHYDGAPGGILALERDIAAEVSRSSGLSSQPSVPRCATHSSDAYEDYLKGRYFYNKMTEDDLRKSVAHFETAIAEDPGFALPYAGLADTYRLFAFLGMLPGVKALERARAYTAAALRCDPHLGEAHVSLAEMKKLRDWDWEGAEAEYQRALDLNPNYAPGHQLYAAHLSALGRFEESGLELRRALELDPLSLVVNMEAAWNFYMARDFQSAFEQSWTVLAMEPRFAPAQHTLGLAYEQMGMLEEAIIEFQNARVCSGGHPAAIAALGHAYAIAGKQREAEETLRELGEMSKTRYVSPYWLGILYAGCGQDASALESLDRAVREHDVWLVWLKVEPRFDRLRADWRFEGLLRSVRL